MKNQDNKFNKVEVHAPSNIAFVKYWGKTGRQLPLNPSLSMTLRECKTITSIEYCWGSPELNHSKTMFEGVHSDTFHNRLNLYLHSIKDLYPELDELHLKFSSRNTFPHSAGIASSASAYAAIGYGLSHIISQKRGTEFDSNLEASKLARHGSGSASRSINGPFVRWGADKSGAGSNHYASMVDDVHEIFDNFHDCILLVDENEKSVSSSMGHALMQEHPFKDARINQANSNFEKLILNMRDGDLESFGEIVENEALTLHALMMSSSSSYVLLKPSSLAIISKVREFRTQTRVPLYFTIDAGPNIHLLYPDSFKDVVEGFIKTELRVLCVADSLFDTAGTGASINE